MRIKWLYIKRMFLAKFWGVKRFGRRIPKKGALVDACCPNFAIKTVDHVDIWNDSIVYTDGTSDSIWHCGWVVLHKTGFVICPDCLGESNHNVDVNCGTCGCAGIIPNPKK